MSSTHCPECGVELPADNGACLDLFHALLAAEATNDELRRMHGLTVMTYFLQHPSLTKPWYQAWGRDAARCIFRQGEDWQSVLLEGHPRGAGRQRSAAILAARKAAGPITMPDWVIAKPIPGERTVRSVNPLAPAGQEAQILAWARSAARHRYLDPDAG